VGLNGLGYCTFPGPHNARPGFAPVFLFTVLRTCAYENFALFVFGLSPGGAMIFGGFWLLVSQ
jgi:hypothetical protein